MKLKHPFKLPAAAAKAAFSGAPSQLLASLNSTLSRLARSGDSAAALHLFLHIHSSPCLSPDSFTLSSALSAAAHLRYSSLGAQLHSLAARSGLSSSPHVSNALLSLYSKCLLPSLARRLFDEISFPDAYSWTTLLSAYARSGLVSPALHLLDDIPLPVTAPWNAVITGSLDNNLPHIALQLFCEMHRRGVPHDHYSFSSVLTVCCSPQLLIAGRQVHCLVITTGFLAKVSVINTLLTMYFSCGGVVSDANCLFEESMGIRNEISFNAMISGLTSCAREIDALDVFKRMRECSYGPTDLTLVSIFSACSSLEARELGAQIHAQAVKFGYENCVLVGNAAISMYSCCGDLRSAGLVFCGMGEKDTVSWNSMIAGYAQGSCYESAIEVYQRMCDLEVESDEFTCGSLIACSRDFRNAEMFQAQVTKNGLMLNTQVGNVLLSVYSDMGMIDQAYRIFREMPFKNLISWNSMVSGCMLNGLPLWGLELFCKMRDLQFKPNSFTLSTVLSTCAGISALKHGEQIHALILKSGFGSDTAAANALVTVYSKCGVLHYSSRVFHNMPEKDVVSWNAMVSAYAQHGEGKEAISCFEAMRGWGHRPDHITFTAVLSACSHAGLMDEGIEIFSSMIDVYGIEPSIDHYSCVIDLLGRAGCLDEAERLISNMPFCMASDVWWALLSSCRTYGNVRLGRVAADYLLKSEPENPTIYVLLSNICAAAGQWEEAANIRKLVKKNGVVKTPGYSWMEA